MIETLKRRTQALLSSRLRLLVIALLVALVIYPNLGSNQSTPTPAQTAATDGAVCNIEARPADCPANDQARVPSDQQLANKYAPILHVTNTTNACGGVVDALPMSVEAVLDNPDVALRRRSSSDFVKYAPSAADLFSADLDAYLDLPGDPRRPGCRYARDGQRLSEGETPVAYAHIVRRESTHELALQYWFFFYFNDWTANHEGDWEMIQLTFPAANAREALMKEPVRITYAQHNGGEVAPWQDDRVQREGDHPAVYVSSGSNASFFAPEVYLGRGEDRSGFGCDDASHSNSRQPVRVVVLPHEPKTADDPYAWLAFKGRWGEVTDAQFSGPTGPIRKWQWWGPFDWEAHSTRVSSTPLPLKGALTGVGAFCQFVSFGSDDVLPFVDRLVDSTRDPLVAAAFLSAAGLCAVTSAGIMPALVLRSRRRTRRRSASIFLDALTLYRKHLLLFLPLGLAGLAVSLIASTVPWPAAGLLSAVSLIDLPGAVFAQRLVVFIALRELQLGVVYLLVMFAATAAVARLRRNEDTTVFGALADLGRLLPSLVLPRLAGMVAVVGVGLTVVGLPWALRQVVRWQFVEQAVLLRGSSGREALTTSAEAVDESWWWCAGLLLAVTSLLILAAPTIGIAVMLGLQASPLDYINFGTSLVYALIVPYAAIVLSLAYLELTPEREE